LPLAPRHNLPRAIGASRTVSTFAASCGSEHAYSVPPMFPLIMCPSGCSSCRSFTVKSARTSPVIAFALAVEAGETRD
jgi:hypothetical protein